MLPAHMDVEEARQRRKEAAEAQRAADRQAAQQKRDEEAEDKQQLMLALRTARKEVADSLGQVNGEEGMGGGASGMEITARQVCGLKCM